VRQHLRELYLRAVEQLEQANRIEEAAFAQAELLYDAPAAAGLLERHGRLTLAAQLAEARQLPPEMVVRLWWRAGDRRRALEVARSRGAFSAAIARLAEVDPVEATALRAEWVRACRDAGDYVSAVDVAWPDETLRAQSREDITNGLALGGEVRARLLVYLISTFASDDASTELLELLEDAAVPGRNIRRTVLVALAELPALDTAKDRELCTAALRSLLRDPVALDEIGAKAAHRVIQNLRSRADPLMNADMPAIRTRRAETDEALELSLGEEPGQLAVLDAVLLADDSMFLALGGYGVRLLTPDGRVRARWDIPTHQLVVADHGGTVLMVSHNGDDREIYRLDLATRTVRRWTTLRVREVLSSFDGGVLPVVDDDGIAFLDTTAETPRIIWRELDISQTVVRIGRTPSALTALVQTAPTALTPNALTQLWSWDLPESPRRVRRLFSLRLQRSLGPGGDGSGLALLRRG
jgi:hypothetical protein